MPWVIWITGLPGSGKSTIAAVLKKKIPDAVILRMDELRKIVTPKPSYSDEEREYVYRALVFTAKNLYKLGHNVIIDATGNRKSWRQLARKLIKNFFEVYLKCPLNVCMMRERKRVNTHGAPRKIYEKGKPVPGVRVPYEKPVKPEIIIDTEKEIPMQAVKKILTMLCVDRNTVKTLRLS
ncbi:MAG: adenylyl-sulfate kinase [Nitrospirae bacterium]|nr:adenylyl-sulfate kinase [Nitrospirota bacterium]